MVQYYNLSEISNINQTMELFSFLSVQSNNIGFPLFIMGILLIIPSMLMIQRGMDVNLSIHYSSLFTSLMAVFFWISGIVLNPLFVFIPVVIYITTLSIRWYNKDR